MKVLWQALDGRQFIISADSMEEAQKTIQDLREELNVENPDFIAIEGDTEKFPELKQYTHLDSLPEDLQEEIKDAMNLSKELSPDPKDMH